MISESDTGRRTLGPQGGWIVRSHISWRGERNIAYKGVETSPKLEGKPGRESLKRTISARGELRLLQMVSEPDTGRCVSENTGPKGGGL